MSLLIEFWTTYNSEESYAPFVLPLFGWTSAYLYSIFRGFSFNKWYVPIDRGLLELSVESATDLSSIDSQDVAPQRS